MNKLIISILTMAIFSFGDCIDRANEIFKIIGNCKFNSYYEGGVYFECEYGGVSVLKTGILPSLKITLEGCPNCHYEKYVLVTTDAACIMASKDKYGVTDIFKHTETGPGYQTVIYDKFKRAKGL